MGHFLLIQCKRLGRYLPVALCITALLLGGLVVAAGQLFATGHDTDNQKVRIAIAGHTDHPLIQVGLVALTSFDSTRMSMEVVAMEESAAKEALSRWEISAYAVIPDGFMEDALKGHLKTIRFVSQANAGDLFALFKAEITQVVSDLVLGAQKGVFGLGDALTQNQLTDKLPGQMDRLAITYADCILLRDRVYTVEELGVTDNLGLEDSLLCGLCVLLLLLMALPFAPVLICSDYALARVLHARRVSATRQVVGEVIAYGLMLSLMVALPVAGVLILLPDAVAVSLPTLLVRLLPVVWCLTTLSYLLYSLTGHLIGGVLAHFFLSLALCFVSGCLYPVFFFPSGVQQVANLLPTGLARAQLAGCLTGADTTQTGWLLAAYGGLFFLMAWWLRYRRMKGVTE